MPYRTDFKWIEKFSEYSQEEQKVMLALSHDKFKWRNRDRLATLTKIDEKELDGILAKLIQKGDIVPSFGKKSRRIIFGLKERVRD